MMRLRNLALATSSALVLSACASGAAAPSAPETVAATPSGPDQGALYADLDNPIRPEEFQGASILDVDRYRPTYRLTACEAEPLEAATPEASLAAAIAQAQAYSQAEQGLGLIVMQDGAIVHESYAGGMDAASLTASASMAKSVLALLFGIAQDKGLVGPIDAPIAEYLSEWEGDPRGAITLRQMLTMSSGLAQSDFMQLIFAPDVGVPALATPRAGEPDTEFAYNNGVSKLLAMALDRRVRGAGYASLAQFFHAELWCPMGGGEALLWVDAAANMRGYAGVHASLRDWARVGELIRNRGMANGRQIVPAQWIDEMAKPSVANPQYGLHVWLGGEWTAERAYNATNPIKILHSEPFAAKDIVYLDGFGGQRVYVLPSQEVTIVRVGEANLKFDDSRLPNLIARALD